MPFILNPFTKNFDWTAAPSSPSNSFETIQVPSGTSPVADSSTDILTLAAGSGITIVGNSTTDTVTIDTVAPSISVISASDVDWSILGKTGGLYKKDLSEDTTLTFSNFADGYCVNIRIKNPASWLLSFADTIIWLGTPYTAMPTGGKSAIFSVFYDGSTYFGVFALEP